MPKAKKIQLDFVIDKLTNSIENVVTKDVLKTDVVPFTSMEKNYKTSQWQFDWKLELKNSKHHIYKLIIEQNPDVIQGLVSFHFNNDHVFMNLIESAAFNKGKNKIYSGVPGNLIAFLCKISFEKGFNGLVSFIAKTSLIEHYQQSLGAKYLAKNTMFIDTPEANKLVKQYFKN